MYSFSFVEFSEFSEFSKNKKVLLRESVKMQEAYYPFHILSVAFHSQREGVEYSVLVMAERKGWGAGVLCPGPAWRGGAGTEQDRGVPCPVPCRGVVGYPVLVLAKGVGCGRAGRYPGPSPGFYIISKSDRYKMQFSDLRDLREMFIVEKLDRHLSIPEHHTSK